MNIWEYLNVLNWNRHVCCITGQIKDKNMICLTGLQLDRTCDRDRSPMFSSNRIFLTYMYFLLGLLTIEKKNVCALAKSVWKQKPPRAIFRFSDTTASKTFKFSRRKLFQSIQGLWVHFNTTFYLNIFIITETIGLCDNENVVMIQNNWYNIMS